MTNKGIYTKIVDTNITKGKPRASGFTVSTEACCKSPGYLIVATLIFAVFYDLYGSAPTRVKSCKVFNIILYSKLVVIV